MAELTGLLEDFLQRSGVPAVIGAVVDSEGDLRIHAAGSTRRDEPNDHASAEDTWHIGSCGKSMTSVLFARLVEAGLADWGTPVRELFPDVHAADRGWGEPTIDDLLRCRAGVAPNPTQRQMIASWKSTAAAQDQRDEAARSVLSSPPKQPGTFTYSNLGYVVVGAAIDRIANVPYEEALATYVLEPLVISSLGLGPPPRVCGHKSRLRLGPFMAGKGRAMAPDDPKSDNPTLLTPAGRMHLTVADWAKFQRLFLNEGLPLLKPDTLRHLLELPEGQQGPQDSMAMGWVSGDGLGGSYGMQGSNTLWAACALIDQAMERTAMVIANDGRMSTLSGTAFLAKHILAAG